MIVPAIFIVWPTRRWVSEGKIKSMYDDAVANGKCVAGEQSMEGQATALHDAGLITLGRPREWEK